MNDISVEIQEQVEQRVPVEDQAYLHFLSSAPLRAGSLPLFSSTTQKCRRPQGCSRHLQKGGNTFMDSSRRRIFLENKASWQVPDRILRRSTWPRAPSHAQDGYEGSTTPALCVPLNFTHGFLEALCHASHPRSYIFPCENVLG